MCKNIKSIMFSLNNEKAVRRTRMDIENKIKARLNKILSWKWNRELKGKGIIPCSATSSQLAKAKSTKGE